MCGIAGSIALHSNDAVQGHVLDAMLATLRHRGPDATGRYRHDAVAIGFQRLSFLDLEGGGQPIQNESGALVLACNGEIFNHRALRAQLENRGHRFRTRTDVEVLLHLYEEEGIGMLRHLDGQFAFALYDANEKQLILARDRAGIAPLFYCDTGAHVVFGSEVKAVLRHPGVPREADLTGLDQILTYPGLVSPRTMFQTVRSVRSGHYLLVRDGTVSEHQYWDLDYPQASPDEVTPGERESEGLTEQLRELLRSAVLRRLDADVPVGFYLSGGLDSSLIAALAAEAGPLHSFSVTFPDLDIDESGYQRLMATKTGSVHHEVPFSSLNLLSELQRMVWHAETPVRESYNACSLAMSAAAREHGVKAVLSGEGADELFGGYVGYRFDRLRPGRADSSDHADDALEATLRNTLWGSPDVFYERRYHAWRAEKLGLYSPQVLERFAATDCLRESVVDTSMLRGRSRLAQRSYLDFHLRLSDHLLSDHGDRMALANSVEARYPFLDRDVIDFARTVPDRLKVGPAGEKLILKRAAKGLVPPGIIGREKFGFRAPGSPFLLRQKTEWVEDMLSSARIRRQGYFDHAAVDHLRATSRNSDRDLHPHIDDDLLLVVLTFGILLDSFGLPDLG